LKERHSTRLGGSSRERARDWPRPEGLASPASRLARSLRFRSVDHGLVMRHDSAGRRVGLAGFDALDDFKLAFHVGRDRLAGEERLAAALYIVASDSPKNQNYGA
jgi:hypothetical protein